ncbi:MAG: hypothetical protein H7336_09995 [Bacteriovorax sp.]|nr:hypothetical protein [Bacteriovorax sp.]
MKALILTTLLLSSTLVLAQIPIVKKDTPSMNGGIIVNNSLQKLMDIPGVKEIYESCKKRADSLTEKDRTDKIITCLWDDVKTKPDIKKKVETAYAEEAAKKPEDSSGGRNPASAPPKKADIISKKIVATADYEKDPAVIALSKFYGDKLEQILDPDKALTKEEIKSNTILAIDHKKFIDLYKSELGKTIISAFTSYCIDTDPDTCEEEPFQCTINEKPEKRIDARKTNLESLAKASLEANSKDGKKWTRCITSVSKNCVTDKDKQNNPDSIIDKLSETVKRSCLIMDYVASARKNIMLVDGQQKFYEDLQKYKTTDIVQNAKSIDAKRASTDAILDMSSKDVKTSLEAPIKKEEADLETCYKDDVIVNPEACKQFLSTDKNKNEMAIAELGMREMAQQGILETNLNASDKNVAAYLKEEGYQQSDIDQMTGDPSKLIKTKEEILDRYKNKKAAIVKEMADKINSKTSETEGKIEANDKDKMKNIKKELASRSADLIGLVKFNNIVSSYLVIDNGGGKENNSRNTASLYGELEGMNAEDKKVLNKQIDEAKLSRPKTNGKDESSVSLSIDTINGNFMKYKTQDVVKDKKK